MVSNQSTTPKIVVIGGGTGSFTLLTSLKNYTHNLTAVVNMVDDGGSTGKLRDELGVLPPGDVRQCLVALSDTSEELRELFNFRFGEGGLAGHSFGNLFLSALERLNGGFGEAVAIASQILNVQGSVAPVTLEQTKLTMIHNGNKTVGQVNVETSTFHGSDRPTFALEPAVTINPAADVAIRSADLVVIAPGNLYSSLVPNLLVEGMREAIQNRAGKLVVVANLVNKKFQTDGMSVMDYCSVLADYFGGIEQIDHLLYNNATPPKGLMEKYANQGELLVAFDEDALAQQPFKAHGSSLISSEPVKRSANDNLMQAERNFIRHDADKVSRMLMKLYYS